tara:strand:+ start:402 stop:869 length:468 start_codon:yes stop_codon:yes gene_type:complete
MGIVVNRVKDLINTLTPPKLAEEYTELSSNEVFNALLSKQIINVGMVRKTLDAKYWACGRLDFHAIVTWDWTDEKKYIAEKYDCDNFAFSFKARMDRKFHLNNVGLVIDYSGGHAYNCVVFADGTAELFEPQTDKFVTSKIGSGKYICKDGLIIL